MSRDGVNAQIDHTHKKAAKEARKRAERLTAEREAIHAVGAVDIARCPTHGLHGRRDTCYVCGDDVELVAMVPVEERDRLRLAVERIFRDRREADKVAAECLSVLPDLCHTADAERRKEQTR